MSSGKKKTTNTTVNTNDPPAWSTGYYQNALERAQTLATRPYQAYGGPTVAGFSGDQEDSFELARQQAAQNSQIQGAAGNYLTGVIGGQYDNPYMGQSNAYAGENPYLNNMIDAAGRDITQRYTDSTLPNQLAQFNAGGAYGGSAMQQALSQGQQNLAQQLSDTNFQYRNEDYNRQAQLAESALNRNSSLYQQNQQNRQGAIAALPGLQAMGQSDANQLLRNGSLQQALQQQAINDDRAEFDRYSNWDANNLGLLTNALGSIKGGTSTGSVTGDNPNYKSASENAAGYTALIASLWG